MSASYLRLTKSETRQIAEREHHEAATRRLGDPTEWHMTNQTFFVAFVAIAALITVLALVLR
jgi:hypothetical protein